MPPGTLAQRVHVHRSPVQRDMYAGVPTGDGQPGRLGVHRIEAIMVTQTRWTTPSVASGTILETWRRRKGVDEQQRNAALHEWENEGGTEEVPLRSTAAVAPQG